jgi:ureidoacrylate peracid hydrolase
MGEPNQEVRVAARPEALSLDLRKTAVLVVDMQNDFGSERGMFALAGIPIDGIKAVVGPIANLIAAARRAGLPIIYIKMGFSPDLSDAGLPNSPIWRKHVPLRVGERVTAPDGRESRILIRGTWNTEILPALAPLASDIIIEKNRYSGFHGTKLDEVLRGSGIENLVLTGCTTSMCVEATLRDAVSRNYTCLILSDCTAEPVGADLQRSNHEASLLMIERLLGWVAHSGELITALETLPSPRRSPSP